MTTNLQTISQAGVDFIKRAEFFSAVAYPGEEGKPTIGYGETEGVKLGDTITKEIATQKLETKLARTAAQVLSSVKVPLTQNQLDALCSFVYNAGLGAFHRSDLLQLLNLGAYESIPDQLLRWKWITKDGEKIESEGLLMRRLKEAALWEGTF